MGLGLSCWQLNTNSSRLSNDIARFHAHNVLVTDWAVSSA